MHVPTRLLRRTLALLIAVAAAAAGSAFNAPTPQSTTQPAAGPVAPDLRALDGEWIYVEDRTEGRPLEQLGPPMDSLFSLRIEEDGAAVILERGHGAGQRNVPVVLDGSITERPGEREGALVRYRGQWKDGAFTCEIEFVRGTDMPPSGLIRREFRPTPEGLIVRSVYDGAGSFASSPEFDSVGLYRHAQDIPMPAPARAAIADVGWLAGAWVVTRSSGGSIEERWSPPGGGSMLAVSRTVNRNGRMSAFEYLRIIERDGVLVYIAQPNGAASTEFVLTELSAGPDAQAGTRRAVFDNPRHDYPKRIVYELSAEGRLTTTIGFMIGGTPRKTEYSREDQVAR